MTIYVISMPGATLHDSISMSSEAFLLFNLPLVELIADFLAGVTVKSLLSGGMILIDRATRSLFLKEGVRTVILWKLN